MGVSTRITSLAVRDASTRAAQDAALQQAMLGRATYAFSHIRPILRVSPAGELHIYLMGEDSHPRTNPTLRNPRLTRLWADLPRACDPSAARKSPQRLAYLLDQLHEAYRSGQAGQLHLNWEAPWVPKPSPLCPPRPAAMSLPAGVPDLPLVAQPLLPAVRLETGRAT